MLLSLILKKTYGLCRYQIIQKINLFLNYNPELALISEPKGVFVKSLKKNPSRDKLISNIDPNTAPASSKTGIIGITISGN